LLSCSHRRRRHNSTINRRDGPGRIGSDPDRVESGVVNWLRHGGRRCRVPAGEAHSVRSVGEGERDADRRRAGDGARPHRGRRVRVPRGGRHGRRRRRVQQRHATGQGRTQETYLSVVFSSRATCSSSSSSTLWKNVRISTDILCASFYVF